MIPQEIKDDLDQITLTVLETGKTWTFFRGALGHFQALKVTIERLEPIDDDVARSLLESAGPEPVDPARL